MLKIILTKQLPSKYKVKMKMAVHKTKLKQEFAFPSDMYNFTPKNKKSKKYINNLF